LLPETLGAGCAFLDYDGDGWQDILLVNGTIGPDTNAKAPSTLKLYRNNRNGTFSDVTHSAGLDLEMYGMGVAVGDYDNDGYPDILITCVGQNRLFKNTGKGTFVDVTKASGLGGRQAQHLRICGLTFDRDGLLDLFVCNYVKWSPSTMSFAASTASTSLIARPKPIAERPAGCFTIGAMEPSRTSRPPAEFSTAARSRWVSPCSTTIATAGPICW
jgi:hypothetical protein